MTWILPKYERAKVNRAGEHLKDQTDLSQAELDDVYDIVGNWRATHALPLQSIKMLLRSRAKVVDPQSTVAQRLKRIPSIRKKLEIQKGMRLTQMQDIGGCRAIVKDMEALNQLRRAFKKYTTQGHTLKNEKDYIGNPKADGYRSHHYIFSYYSFAPDYEKLIGKLIEIQIRTRLQHYWATAVETVDTFTGQSLKTSLNTKIGDENWRRFFALTSNAFAIKERHPLVSGMSGDISETTKEIRELTEKLSIYEILRGLSASLVGMPIKAEVPKTVKTFLLQLDIKNSRIQYWMYTQNALEQAERDYVQKEREYNDNKDIQVLKVTVDSLYQLKKAYPNYLLDAEGFLKELDLIVK